MNMQEILAEFETGLHIGLTEDDLTKTHDTLVDFAQHQGRALRTSAHGAAYKRVAVVDAGEIRYCYVS